MLLCSTCQFSNVNFLFIFYFEKTMETILGNPYNIKKRGSGRFSDTFLPFKVLS